MNAQAIKDARIREFEELKLDVERLKQRDDDWCQILWEQNKRIELLEGFIRMFKSVSSSQGTTIASVPKKPQAHAHADLDTSGPIQ